MHHSCCRLRSCVRKRTLFFQALPPLPPPRPQRSSLGTHHNINAAGHFWPYNIFTEFQMNLSGYTRKSSCAPVLSFENTPPHLPNFPNFPRFPNSPARTGYSAREVLLGTSDQNHSGTFCNATTHGKLALRVKWGELAVLRIDL